MSVENVAGSGPINGQITLWNHGVLEMIARRRLLLPIALLLLVMVASLPAKPSRVNIP